MRVFPRRVRPVRLLPVRSTAPGWSCAGFGPGRVGGGCVHEDGSACAVGVENSGAGVSSAGTAGSAAAGSGPRRRLVLCGFGPGRVVPTVRAQRGRWGRSTVPVRCAVRWFSSPAGSSGVAGSVLGAGSSQAAGSAWLDGVENCGVSGCSDGAGSVDGRVGFGRCLGVRCRGFGGAVPGRRFGRVFGWFRCGWFSLLVGVCRRGWLVGFRFLGGLVLGRRFERGSLVRCLGRVRPKLRVRLGLTGLRTVACRVVPMVPVRLMACRFRPVSRCPVPGIRRGCPQDVGSVVFSVGSGVVCSGLLVGVCRRGWLVGFRFLGGLVLGRRFERGSAGSVLWGRVRPKLRVSAWLDGVENCGVSGCSDGAGSVDGVSVSAGVSVSGAGDSAGLSQDVGSVVFSVGSGVVGSACWSACVAGGGSSGSVSWAVWCSGDGSSGVAGSVLGAGSSQAAGSAWLDGVENCGVSGCFRWCRLRRWRGFWSRRSLDGRR